MTKSGAIGVDDAASSESVPPDRRTRKRDLRRDEIYRAAHDLFVEQGFDNTTMEQIADRADMARATVFNHFPRKTAFLEEWTTRRRARAATSSHRHDPRKRESVVEVLQQYMREMARISQEYRRETVALMDATLHNINLLAHPALAEELAGIIESGRSTGEVPKSVNADQAGVLAATAYFAVLSQWIEADPPPFDLEVELRRMMELVLFGVARPPAEAARGRRKPPIKP